MVSFETGANSPYFDQKNSAGMMSLSNSVYFYIRFRIQNEGQSECLEKNQGNWVLQCENL